ncbi:SMP-30/gluconolactonase/LRE family protein [Cognatishimia sp. 1_MG-2023]|uniref:SMP-30/gluconolactonase/LRE family protein n=1 Tax=Cognatishimia sp. 1_MG-2023 TaxID=3062642 RepID=UPI0026E172F8|nr:SMP-30/gluconolactonase/LRE family protein [Cognatishimia sp. 1_MG-2023]MDO6727013.1 SMP-30/gluconolactonase/LRE family protein [Cognatishimia sp. 1_MG-2023]
MAAVVFDDRQCALGEGPLWHPLRQQFFWFDIIGHKLLSRVGDEAMEWPFEEFVSAAGWVDHDTLLVASETGLYRLDLTSDEIEFVAPIESDNEVTRSNDGRADPQGGFWIGTMGKNGEDKAGSIYRYYKGEVRKLFGNITVTNSICFAPEGDLAYYCDTRKHKIMKVSLDADGWPMGKPDLFVDLNQDGLNPDGSVVDAAGNLWNAQWGANRVACYAPNGQFLTAVEFDATQISCPAFGGADLNMLFATSAAVGLTGPEEGKTFVIDLPDATGQAEHQVIL